MEKNIKTLLIYLCCLAELSVLAGQQSTAMLYSRWAAPLHHVLTTYRWPSALAGSWANSRASRWAIPAFIRAYGINMQEADRAVHEYTTFNDFFARKLVPGARPLGDSEHAVISPGDGSLLVIPSIDEHTILALKQYTFNLEQVLQDIDLADTFRGGTACILRIAPHNYHRFHSPVSGIPSEPRVIHGRYESVQPSVFACGIQPLEVNERHVVLLETGLWGTVAYIPVGALFVGSMAYTYCAGKPLEQGDELGYFQLGGSTIVLLFQPGVIKQVREDISANSAQGRETPVQMGQVIAW